MSWLANKMDKLLLFFDPEHGWYVGADGERVTGYHGSMRECTAELNFLCFGVRQVDHTGAPLRQQVKSRRRK